MDVRTRTRKLVPVIGSMTAAATAIGGLAAVAQVAPVSAEPSGPAVALGVAGLAGAGMFESCDAYFGFGKDEGVLGVVEFDVADVNGADGVAHAVDTDVDVLLVLENKSDDVLECVPFEVTQEQWDDVYEPDTFSLPPWPGPGHYVYPSVGLVPVIEDFGQVVEVGFRVADIPGEHTLVSPEGVKDLASIFLDPEATFFGEIVDQRVLDYIAAEVDAAAAEAYETALADCVDETYEDTSDPDLLAAVEALEALTGNENDGSDVNCFRIYEQHALASFGLAAFESVDYVEEIRLSVPEPTPPTAPVARPAGAAQPASATPQFTG